MSLLLSEAQLAGCLKVLVGGQRTGTQATRDNVQDVIQDIIDEASVSATTPLVRCTHLLSGPEIGQLCAVF